MYWKTFASTLRTGKFWLWELGGITIYAIPALIRLATGSVILPVLGFFETPWFSMYIPGNIVEKVLVNAFFPGGAGAVAGEVFLSMAFGFALKGRQKYFARLSGALLETSAWTLFQLWGNIQNIAGSWGGNLFEYPTVYPLNFALASLSIFTPDIVSFVKSKLVKAYHLISARRER